MAELDVSQCTAVFEVEPHLEYPGRLSTVTGKATHPTLGEVATLRGLKLQARYAWKQAGDFTEIMDGESDEMMHFSTEVFDNDMNLQPWLADGGRRSGTGCWGDELNRGGMVYLEDVTVKNQLVRRGVGSWFLQEFLRSPQIMDNFMFNTHVYCWPTSSGATSVTNENVLAFYHKNGFRRIGRTSFLCYSPDPNHPSHQIAIAADATLLANDFADASSTSPADLEAHYPLHIAIASVKTPLVVDLIHTAHANDPLIIHKKAPDGLTPIHMAAGMQNVHALRTLLELGVGDDLQDAANKLGTTPLEALDSAMRSNRQFMDSMLGIWNGYSVEDLTCQYLLKQALGMPLVPPSEAEYVDQRKLGCTCGQCTDGWLSPRMRFRLAVTAVVHQETGEMNLSYMPGRQPKEEYLLNMPHLPPALYPQVNKFFYQAWLMTFRAIRDLLDAGQMPTPERVATQPAAIPYITRGGKVEFIFDELTDMAKEQSGALGDGTFEEDHDEYHTFPSCDNDAAFSLVRRKLGLDPRLPWGPYGMGEEEEMDEDDDSDEDSF